MTSDVLRRVAGPTARSPHLAADRGSARLASSFAAYHRFARTPGTRAGLERERRGDPGRLPSAWLATLRPRGAPLPRVVQARLRGPRHPSRLLRITHRRPTDAGSRLMLPRPHRRLPRLERLRARCGSAPAKYGEDAPHRLLQPTRVHVHLLSWDRAKPETPPHHLRSLADVLRRGNPGGVLGSGALDGAPPSFERPCPSRRPIRGLAFASAFGSAGAVRSWGGSDRIPSGGTPGRAALSSARRENTPLSDALMTTIVRRSAQSPPEDTSRATSSKVTHRAPSGRLPSTNCPLGPALARRTSNADPPPLAGFAAGRRASDALSLARPFHRGAG